MKITEKEDSNEYSEVLESIGEAIYYAVNTNIDPKMIAYEIAYLLTYYIEYREHIIGLGQEQQPVREVFQKLSEFLQNGRQQSYNEIVNSIEAFFEGLIEYTGTKDYLIGNVDHADEKNLTIIQDCLENIYNFITEDN